MEKIKIRKQVQVVFFGLIASLLFLSKSAPVIISCYLLLAFSFMDVFHFLKSESEKELSENEKNNFWQTSLFFVFFQILSFALLCGLTWLVIYKKGEVLKNLIL